MKMTKYEMIILLDSMIKQGQQLEKEKFRVVTETLRYAKKLIQEAKDND